MSLNDKPVIDLTKKDIKVEEETVIVNNTKIPSMFFTVTFLNKNTPMHVLVRAESALHALQFTQEQLKAPVLGVHITEYSKYIDAIEDMKIEIEENKKEK